MDRLKVPSAPGVGRVPIKPGKGSDNLNEILPIGKQRLAKRALIFRVSGGSQDRIQPFLLPFLRPLLAPSRLLSIQRTITNLGAQILYFHRSGSSLLLHSLPKADVHRLELFDIPRQAYEMLLQWFPLEKYPADTALVKMKSSEMEMLLTSVRSKKSLDIFKKIPSGQLSAEQAIRFASAIQAPILSGVFALQSLDHREVNKIFSLSVVAGEDSAWLVEQDPAGSGDGVVVRSIGATFSDILLALVMRWSGEIERTDGTASAAPIRRQKTPPPPEKL
jgi:hypothetical protein